MQTTSCQYYIMLTPVWGAFQKCIIMKRRTPQDPPCFCFVESLCSPYYFFVVIDFFALQEE